MCVLKFSNESHLGKKCCSLHGCVKAAMMGRILPLIVQVTNSTEDDDEDISKSYTKPMS